MATPYQQGSESISQAEHISPTKTGDNIEAKRTANYVWDSNSSSWIRQTPSTGDVDVLSSVSSALDHGSNLDIDTTAEQITSTSFSCKFGLTLKADITNTGIIYIGNSDVTAGTTAATDGFPLSAGETLTLEVNNSNIPYAIASANNQKLYWIGV